MRESMIGPAIVSMREAIERAKLESIEAAGWIVIRMKNGQRILTEGKTLKCHAHSVELLVNDEDVVELPYVQISMVEVGRD
jgi:hypothetical protein